MASLVPRPSYHLVFDRLQYVKTEDRKYKKRPQAHFFDGDSLYLGRHDTIHMKKWTSSF